jgi:hypothetical protein
MKLLIFSFLMCFIVSGLPDELNSTVGAKHRQICTRPVFAEIGDDFHPSVNADGCENADRMYFVVDIWEMDLASSIKFLPEYNTIYNGPDEVAAKPIKVSNRNGYIQEIYLKNYQHVVFQILVSNGDKTYYIKCGCPESKRKDLLILLKTIAISE